MRPSRCLHRRNLGDKFSEGARLLWCTTIRRGWTQRDLKEALGQNEGTIPRLLFGDRRPSLEFAHLIEKTLKIPASSWAEPARRFELPEKLPVPAADRKRWAA